MKTFKTFLEENNIVGFQGAGLSSEAIPHDIEDSIVKDKINAILGHVAVAEFLNPKAAVAQMEAKLNQLGLFRSNVPSSDPRNESADEADFSADRGQFSLNFSRYGEIVGKTVDTPIDEIEKEEYVVELNVRYEKLDTGSYKVYGALI